MSPPRNTRIALGVSGVLVAGYGAVLLAHQVHWTIGWLANTGAYLVGGPVLHDLLLAPASAVTGILIARLVPAARRATVATGLITTGILLLIGVPLLWRPDPAQPNPGLQDRHYIPGLLVFLAALWLGLILTNLLRTRLPRRRRP